MTKKDIDYFKELAVRNRESMQEAIEGIKESLKSMEKNQEKLSKMSR